jgi:RHH-type transcriptional regulator, rel operon repressor / antitoxin RelB
VMCYNSYMITRKTATVSVQIERSTEERLEQLAKSTGKSSAAIAAQAITDYLDVNEWQVARIEQALASLEPGLGIPHNRVKEWVTSWNTQGELPLPIIA